MAVQSVQIKTLTSNTLLSNLNSITILNGSTTETLTIGVESSGEVITLSSGQTLSLIASVGFSLPTIDIQGTSLRANIVTT